MRYAQATVHIMIIHHFTFSSHVCSMGLTETQGGACVAKNWYKPRDMFILDHESLQSW